MNAARRGPSRLGEHIDIHLPHGLSDDDDDEDEEEEEEERGIGVVGVNANAGVAAPRLQLPPLPTNTTRDEIENAYREAQLLLQARSEAEEHRALQAQSLAVASKAKKKKGGGQSRDPPPPPELAHLKKLIARVAREFCVLINLWPPVAYWPYITLERPTVDPYDAETRYPLSAVAAGVRVRGPRGQDIAAEALRTAAIAELHDFMGELSVHLTNQWVQTKFQRTVNSRKSHMLDDLRTNRGQIFSGLPNVDQAVLDSNDLVRIRSDPAIQRWISFCDQTGRLKKWPDLFYQPDKAGDIKYLFRAPWIHRAMKLMTHGRKSLTVGHRPRTNVSAVKWGLEDATYGFIAAGAVAMLHLLSGDTSFETTPGPSGFNYPRIHAQIVEHLIKTNDRRQTIFVIGWLRDQVFVSHNAEPTDASSQANEEEAEEDDYDRLDDSDSEAEAPPPARRTLLSSAASKSASSSNQSHIPHSDSPGALPNAASTSASSQLSYASVPGIQTSSTPSHGTPDPQLSYIQQQFSPPVVTLPGALSDVFFAGGANSGYVVATPPASHSSYSHGNHSASAGGIPAQPAPSIDVALPPSLGVHIMPARAPGLAVMPAHAPGLAVAPATHNLAVRAVPPAVPTPVAPAVNNVNLPSLDRNASHFAPSRTASRRAPLVIDTGNPDHIDELSEATSHLDVNAAKRKTGRAKKPAGVPTRQSVRQRHVQG